MLLSLFGFLLFHIEIFYRNLTKKIHILRFPLDPHHMEAISKHLYLYRMITLLKVNSLEASMPVCVVESEVVNSE